MASAHNNKSGPTTNELNLIIANWTDGLPQIQTWTVSLSVLNPNSSEVTEDLQPSGEVSKCTNFVG